MLQYVRRVNKIQASAAVSAFESFENHLQYLLVKMAAAVEVS